MNQKKFFQFNPKPSEKDLAFREELPEGHPFSDEVQFAKAENVDLRRKHAATAQALGFDIETGRRVLNLEPESSPASRVPRDGSNQKPHRAPIEPMPVSPADTSFDNPLNTPTQQSDHEAGVYYSPVFVPQITDRADVVSTPEIDAQAYDLPDWIPQSRTKEHIFYHDGTKFHVVPKKQTKNRQTRTEYQASAVPPLPYDQRSADGHTHPLAENASILPGDIDYRSVELGNPLFIVRNNHVYVIEKLAGQYRYRAIRGEIAEDMIPELEEILEEFQRAQGVLPEDR